MHVIRCLAFRMSPSRPCLLGPCHACHRGTRFSCFRALKWPLSFEQLEIRDGVPRIVCNRWDTTYRVQQTHVLPLRCVNP
jgi:hypothetical protein